MKNRYKFKYTIFVCDVGFDMYKFKYTKNRYKFKYTMFVCDVGFDMKK